MPSSTTRGPTSPRSGRPARSTTCRSRWGRPSYAPGSLPNAGMVVPDLCHDAHDCSLATADTWFQTWMTRIQAGPDWRPARLAVVLTADEDDKSAGNRVLTVVAHPSQQHQS